MQKCSENDLDLSGCLTATAADGAAVNFGKTNGVLTKLQGSVPWMLKVHCIAHRLELCLKDASRGTYFEQVLYCCFCKYYYLNVRLLFFATHFMFCSAGRQGVGIAMSKATYLEI